ncbi:MAG: hypothetical protein HUU50_14025 [Candidatus Brocadiae bacterium]|nr:hypothetical protein [Candidatus Brocadiia bacterium]
MKVYCLGAIFYLIVFAFFLPQIMAEEPELVYQIVEVCEKGLYIKGERTYFYTPSQGSFALPPLDKNQEKKWQENDLSLDTTAIDEKGNLWILLLPEIFCYSLAEKSWKVFPIPVSVIQSQYGESFLSVEIWNGNLWMATNDILWCFFIQENRWESFSYPRNQTGGILKKGPKNALWMGGNAYFDGTSWTVLPACPIPLSFWPRTPHCFAWDKEGQPWLATVQGIYFYDSQYFCWRVVTGKTFIRAYSLALFRGEIYCTDYGDGLYKYTKNQWSKLQTFRPRPDLSCVLSLFAASDDLWLNTYFGIGSFNGKKWISHYDSTQYDKRNSLFNFTLLFVILILFVGIVSFLMIGGARRYRIYGKHARFAPITTK